MIEFLYYTKSCLLDSPAIALRASSHVVTTHEFLTAEDFLANAEFKVLMTDEERLTEKADKDVPKKIDENKAYLKLLKKGWKREDLDRAGFPYHPEIGEGEDGLNQEL